MSDSDRFLDLLHQLNRDGLHTHDARRQGISGNPSQRAKDLASRGIDVATKREHRHGRNGSRFWLASYAPADATAVQPNGADLGSGAPTHRPSAADVSAEPYVLRRDYTDEGDRLGWREMAA